MEQRDKIKNIFGNKLRVRVCGILICDDNILLVKHLGVGANGFLWSPPGGGVEFGENLEDALIREFKEETGLIVMPEKFLFFNEMIALPLHAIEIFFEVSLIGGELKVGNEPELINEGPLLIETRFVNDDFIKNEIKANFHSIFKKISHISEILNLFGHFKS